MLLWLTEKHQILSGPFFLLECLISKCCCGPQESPLYVLRHRRPSSLGPHNLAVVPAILKMRNSVISLRPLLSSKSFKNVCNYKHSWTAPFGVGSTYFKNLHISWGNAQILERWWVRWFRIFFIIVVFPMQKYIVWSVYGFVIFDNISFLLHVLANIHNFDADLRKQ